MLQTIKDGIVTKVFDGSTAIGKGVAIQTPDGTTHLFGHMSAVNVHEGQSLHAGDIIGLSGNTGHSTGPHLHFAQQAADGTFMDPTPYANFFTGDAEKAGVLGKIGEWFANRGAVDQYNPAIQDNHSWFWDWVGSGIMDGLTHLGHWFVFNLPDIMGYGTVLAGISIIVGAAIGKGGMIKPLSIYAITMIIVICILGGV